MTKAPASKAKSPPAETSPPPPAPRGRGRPRKVEGAAPVTAPDPIPRAPDEPDVFAGYITAAQLARQRGLSIHALRAERRRPDGPPFTRDGQRVLYSVQKFRDWLESREEKSGERGGE